MEKETINLLKNLKRCVINEAFGYNDNFEILMNEVNLDYLNKVLAENGEDNPEMLARFVDIDWLAQTFKDVKTIDEFKKQFDNYYCKISDSEAKFLMDKINK